jgi:hypothetical protein
MAARHDDLVTVVDDASNDGTDAVARYWAPMS